jgi:hypothetical protein
MAKMVSLQLYSGGWVDIDPTQVAAIQSVESAGLILNGRCIVIVSGGASFEIANAAETVRRKLNI